MSVLKRIFNKSAKSRVQDDSSYSDSHGLGVAGVNPRKAASLYSIPRRSRSVADGFVSLFVRERKVSTHTLGAPVEFKADPRASALHRSSSIASISTASSDIRCPSELGEQRTSFSSLNDEFAGGDISISVEPPDTDLPTAPTLAPPSPTPSPASTHQLPTELLGLVFNYVPLLSLPTLAVVNRVFYAEATRRMYHTVNLNSQTLSPSGFSSQERGIASLSASRELCKHVRSFRYSLPRLSQRSSPSSTATADRLRLILSHMVNLRALHLENAPMDILHGSKFSLISLHIDFSTLASDQEREHDAGELGTWLSRQRSLTSLRLVNCDSLSLTDSNCLPALSEIAASAAIVTALVPFRPVRRVSMTLGKMDEARTTPSRLMAALSRSAVTLSALELDLTASELPYNVYLQAAATRLQHLQTLSVSGTHRALERLFRHIHHILLPLTELHTVRMTTRPQVPHNHDAEFARVKIWYKLCPSLRLLQFPSRVEWIVTVDAQALTPKVDKREPEAGGLQRLRVL